MARTITVDGIDRTSVISRIGGRFTGKAHMGESSGSELTLDDNSGSISHFDLAALKLITVDEDATTSPTRILRGRLGSHAVERGDHVVDQARSWTLRPQDYNWDLRGFRILGWDRPAETDVERVTALHAYFLNGTGSISPRKRATTDLTTTYIASGNTLALDAKIYSDVDVADILREIAELAGKDFFVTIDGEIFYDLPTSTAYAAGLSIDPDGDGETSFAPLAGVVSAEHGGQEIMTGGALRYGDDQYVEGSDIWGGEGFHDKWEGVLFDAVVQTEAEAQQLLEQIILVRSNEDLSYACTIGLRADQVDLVKYGQTLDFVHPAADVESTKTLRVVQLQLEPDAPGHYLAHLELGFPRVAAPRRPSRTPPVNKPVPSPPSAGVIVAQWHFGADLDDDDGNGWTVNGGGIGGDWAAAGGNPGGNLDKGNLATGNAGNAGATNRPPVTAGTAYFLTADVRNGGGGNIFLDVEFYDAGGAGVTTTRLETTPIAGAWVTLNGFATAPVGAVSVEFRVGRDTGASNNLDVDNVEIRRGVTPPATLGGPGEGANGPAGHYVPSGSVIEHNDLSGKGGTMHDAEQIEVTPFGSIAAANVQDALEEIVAEATGPTDHGALTGLGDNDHTQYALDTDLAAHLADTTDAHDASAVSFDDTGLAITAADVQEMGEALDAAISAGGIPATIFDAAGDLIVASAADAAARLVAGSEDDVLTIVSGVPAWAPPAGGGGGSGNVDTGDDASVRPELQDVSPAGTDLDFSGAATGTSVTIDVATPGFDAVVEWTANSWQYADIASVIGTGNFDIFCRLVAHQPLGNGSAGLFLFGVANAARSAGLAIQSTGMAASTFRPKTGFFSDAGTQYTLYRWPVLLRIARVGTAVTFYWSTSEGRFWTPCGTATSSLDVGRIGFYLHANGAPGGAAMIQVARV